MRTLAVFLALSLAACGSQPESQPATPAPEAPESPVPTHAPVAPPTPPITRDYSPPKLTPEAEKGEKGARNVLLSWAAAMEDRAFGAAYDVLGEGNLSRTQSRADYAAQFADYASVTVAIGNGTPEGAAGSTYYQVPVTLSGERAGGGSYRREGTITLRRVNDVPGASPAQLRWHAESLEWND